MMTWFCIAHFAFISLLFPTELYGAESIFDDEVDRGDEYIDKLLKDMLVERGHEYDPYVLEDSSIGFSKYILFVNVTGEAKLHNGYITGLKSLNRPYHCSVEEIDDKLLVKADLGAGVMNIHYDGTVAFMNFGPTISVNGEMGYIETHMEFTVDAATGRNGKLQKFVIVDMRGMSVTITGLGPINWALNYLISGVTSLFKGYMKSMIENSIKSHIAENLPNYQFPVGESENIDQKTGVRVEIVTSEAMSPETDNLEDIMIGIEGLRILKTIELLNDLYPYHL